MTMPTYIVFRASHRSLTNSRLVYMHASWSVSVVTHACMQTKTRETDWRF